ncbi:MAG: polyamine aminopropyltransferase [Lentisphaeria bacterium]|nr:polyamine aminopropyltransferase [Lentisphaeria bacterium]
MDAQRWVSEVNEGWGLTVKVKKQLCDIRSQYQHIEIFETENLGHLLMLDGIVQLTSYDEFAYHEMMANLPFYACSHVPERALVIGGGDGGVLRELGRHPELRTIDICEIDAEVIRAAQKFLPETSCGYDDPRVKVNIGDGSCFIKEHPGCYDIIIVDSTDPGGPGEPLFGENFYRDMKKALTPGGVIATQAESYYLLPEIACRVVKFAGRFFKSSGFAQINVPTYPTGVIGCCLGSDEGEVFLPRRMPDAELQKQLRYYSPEVHRSAFELPVFARRLFSKNGDEK